MDKEKLKRNQGKIFAVSGVLLILIGILVSLFSIGIGIIFFAGGGVLLMSLIKEE